MFNAKLPIMNLIILPVYNEEKTIYETTRNILHFCDNFFTNGDYNLLIINDGSTDKTVENCKKIKHYKLNCINNMFDQGKGSALKTGYVLSRLIYSLNDNDNIIFIDGDGQISVSEIRTMFNVGNTYQADVVVGNKRHKYSSTSYTLTRRIISQTYNSLIRFLFDMKLEDTQCGIKLFKAGALEKVIKNVTTKQYAFDLELLVALRANKYRIVDAPVSIEPQMNRGSISLKAIIGTFIDTLKVWSRLKGGIYGKSYNGLATVSE